MRQKILQTDDENDINILLQPELQILSNPFKNENTTYKRRKHIFNQVPLPKEIAVGIRTDRMWNKQNLIYDCHRIVDTLTFYCKIKILLVKF